VFFIVRDQNGLVKKPSLIKAFYYKSGTERWKRNAGYSVSSGSEIKAGSREAQSLSGQVVQREKDGLIPAGSPTGVRETSEK